MAANRSLSNMPASHYAIASAVAAVGVVTTYVTVRGISRSLYSSYSSGHGTTSPRSRKQKSLGARGITTPSDAVALDQLIAAFGPDGRNARGTAPGCMVASPSKKDDGDSNGYWYQWPRDTGLCTRSLVEAMKQAEAGKDFGGYTAEDIERRIKDFVTMSIKLQHTANPCGTFDTDGLGEAKFEVDGSAFTGSWGRPQMDFVLRSLTAILYMRHILLTRPEDDKSVQFCKNHIWDKDAGKGKDLLVRDDLDYLARAWKSTSFELWEEVNADAGQGEGGHFHVLMVQRRSLLEGAKLARMRGVEDEESATRWATTAKEISERLEKFWNPEGKLNMEGGDPKDSDQISWTDDKNLSSIPKSVLSRPHILPTLARISGQPKPVQADTCALLGFTHGWDGRLDSDTNEGEGGDTWLPWSDRCLATLDRNIEVFSKVYPLNKGFQPQDGVLCGRYPEDVYDGVQTTIGHPWFLCTFAVANVLYITVAHYAATSKPIKVNEFNLPLFTKAYPDLIQSIRGGGSTGISDVDVAKYPDLSNLPVSGGGSGGSSATKSSKHRRTASVSGPPSLQVYHRGSREWSAILHGLYQMADNFLSRAGSFAEPGTGKMSEQIERKSGKMRGARELSWSFASLMAAKQARGLSGWD